MVDGFNIEFYDCDKSGDFHGIKKSKRIVETVKGIEDVVLLFNEIKNCKDKEEIERKNIESIQSIINWGSKVSEIAIKEMAAQGFLQSSSFFCFDKESKNIVVALKPRKIFKINTVKINDVGESATTELNPQDINIKKYDYLPASRHNITKILKNIFKNLHKSGYLNPQVLEVTVSKSLNKMVDVEIIYNRNKIHVLKNVCVFVKGSPANADVLKMLSGEISPLWDKPFTPSSMKKIHDAVVLILKPGEVSYVGSLENGQNEVYVTISAYINKQTSVRGGFYLDAGYRDDEKTIKTFYIFDSGRASFRIASFFVYKESFSPYFCFFYKQTKWLSYRLSFRCSFHKVKIIPNNVYCSAGCLIQCNFKNEYSKAKFTSSIGFNVNVFDKSYSLMCATLGKGEVSIFRKHNYFILKLTSIISVEMDLPERISSICSIYFSGYIHKMLIHSITSIRYFGFVAGMRLICGVTDITDDQNRKFNFNGIHPSIGVFLSHSGKYFLFLCNIYSSSAEMSLLFQTKKIVILSSFILEIKKTDRFPAKICYARFILSHKQEYYRQPYDYHLLKI